MGRKADRLRALEQRASDDRKAMEAACDQLDASDVGDAATCAAYDLLADRLDDDPRPASDEGSLHWLHVQDGDRLLWRIVADLIELHDAEAVRLGRPTWRNPPRKVRVEEAEDAGPDLPEPGPIDSVITLRLDDAVLIPVLGRSLLATIHDVTWHEAEGWRIRLDPIEPDVADEPERTIEGCEDSP